MIRYAIPLALTLVASPSMARDRDHRPFTGKRGGLEIGWLENRAAVEVFQYDATGEAGVKRTITFRSHGIGGGAFAGYDKAVSERVRVGGELSGVIGGSDDRLAFQGGTLSLNHRYGVRVALQAGYVVTPRVLVYGQAGYGGDAYRVHDTIPVQNSADYRWQSGLLLGGGAEYQVTPDVGVRLDFKHVHDQTNQLFLGVPVRF